MGVSTVSPEMITAPMIDPVLAIEAMHDGAQVIADQFPKALYEATKGLNVGTRQMLQGFLEAQTASMPFSQTATDAMAGLRSFIGLKPVSQVPEFEARFQSLAKQVAAPNLGRAVPLSAGLPSFLNSFTKNLSKLDNAETPEERAAIKQAAMQKMDVFALQTKSDIAKARATAWVKGLQTKGGNSYRLADINALSDEDLNYLGVGDFKKELSLSQAALDKLNTAPIKPTMARPATGLGMSTQQEGKAEWQQYDQDLREFNASKSWTRSSKAGGTFGGGTYIGGSKKYAGIVPGAAKLAKERGLSNEDKLEGHNNTVQGLIEQARGYDQQLSDMGVTTKGRVSGLHGRTMAHGVSIGDHELDAQESMLQDVMSDMKNIRFDIENKISDEVPRASTGAEITKLVEETPGFQTQMNIQQKALERSQAARGVLQSGKGAHEVSQLAQGLAEQGYNAHVSRLGALAGLNMPVAQQGIANSSQFGSAFGGQSQTAGGMAGNSIQNVAQARQQAFGAEGQFRFQAASQNAQMQLQSAMSNQQADLQGQMFNASAKNSMTGQMMGLGSSIGGKLLGGLF